MPFLPLQPFTFSKASTPGSTVLIITQDTPNATLDSTNVNVAALDIAPGSEMTLKRLSVYELNFNGSTWDINVRDLQAAGAV